MASDTKRRARPASPSLAAPSLADGTTADRLDTARRLMADPTLSMEEIASRIGVGRTTLYRAPGRAVRAHADAAMAGSGVEEGNPERKSRTPGRKPRASSPATAT